MKLFIGNLDEKIENSHLLEAFSEFGTVQSANVVKNKFTQKSAGYGFVEMPDDEQAVAVIRKVNGGIWEGKKLVVRKAIEKKNN